MNFFEFSTGILITYKQTNKKLMTTSKRITLIIHNQSRFPVKYIKTYRSIGTIKTASPH